MDRDGQQGPPDQHRRHNHCAAAAVDPDQVAAGDGQDVAEQVGHQVHAHALEEADSDETKGQRAVREDSEQCVGGQSTLLLEQEQQQGQRDAHEDDAAVEVDAEDDAEQDAQQRAVRDRIAEIGHAPPHHEAAEGPGGERHADAARERAREEVVKHGAVSRPGRA